MKYILITLLISLSSLFCAAQSEIKKLEIYAKMYNDSFWGGLPTKKSNIKKTHTIYVEITHEWAIKSSKINESIDELKKGRITSEEVIRNLDGEDIYHALVIVHYSNSRKEKYYIGSFATYLNNIPYRNKCLFVSTVYSFLPIYYYNYDEEPDYYKKPCEEDDEYTYDFDD
jgi:hypothetical protein